MPKLPITAIFLKDIAEISEDLLNLWIIHTESRKHDSFRNARAALITRNNEEIVKLRLIK
jgi:hypothetical protein